MEHTRRFFPILGKGLAYLDNAASSLTPEPVLDEMLSYYRTYRANVHRGFSRLSRIASERYDRAHEEVASFIGAKSDELVFVPNATYGINMVALALELHRGDKVVTSDVEHHSNLLPWLRLKRQGVAVEAVEASSSGLLSADSFEDVIDERTRIVSLAHVSNAVGAVQPVEEIGRIARNAGCLFLVDAAQSAPHRRMDVKKIGCDILVFSGHKMLGPTGIGGLYLRREVRKKLAPPIIGGGSATEVNLDGYTLSGGSASWEAGTPNIAGAIGLARAVEFLSKLGMRKVEAHGRRLAKAAAKGMQSLPGLTVYGPRVPQGSIVSFNIEGISPDDVALMLDERDIMVRSGFHCAVPYVKKMSAEGVVRASFYLYNTKEEVERLLAVIEAVGRELS